ncbi:OmpA family protein [Erythrobacter sp. SCSIO 43205]|uniref:flagellar motor protein MotB n=1 Tax=Erythrobacter sp. SCSIO 43205 TaxID=2779361 RepID=UPI001CAA3FAF|nr:flagellar motor protein MotB [Erythrobacter sp. SCSIO 43205]UAB78733.1 OmpA family protein [Erythrobacter sp. SCSIO 43205]
MAEEAAPAPEPLAPIIVKKITIEEGGHHGGAWKVAYADFVTAMMAFFLLLWLLGATEENQRKGIADYFSPTLVKTRQQSAGSAEGMLGGSSLTDVDNYPNAMGQTGTRTITVPRGKSGGPKEGGFEGELSEKQLEELKEEIRKEIMEEILGEEGIAKYAKQVRVMRAPEGIRIDLVDDADFSMFALGTTILTPEARKIIEVISKIVEERSQPLILRGHTDSLPYREGVQANNWSLSAGRAEATRQQLIRSGIPPGRFARIEGVAETEPLIADNPADPRNRRISLLLLEEQGGRQRPRGAMGPQNALRESTEEASPSA